MPAIRDARSFGAAIRSARNEQGISQTELAQRARVSRRTLASIEGGHPNGEIGMFLALLRALDLEITLAPVRPSTFDLDYLDETTDEL